MGRYEQKDLIEQAKAGREWSQRGDAGLQIGLRSMIEGEVNDRVSTLVRFFPNNSEKQTPRE